jgi:hypothetical protein
MGEDFWSGALFYLRQTAWQGAGGLFELFKNFVKSVRRFWVVGV